jgi:hypothetical protein
MILRATGVLLLLGAGLGYAGIVVPARRDLTVAQDGFARAREERQRLRLRVAELERRVQVRARVNAAPPEPGRGDSAGQLRRAVLGVVEGSRVSGVQLSVSAGRARVVAKVHLTLEGSFPDVVPLTGRLVSGPPGLVIERLRLSPKDHHVVADLEGFRVEGAP